MGVLFDYNCNTCKKYIELNKYNLDFTDDKNKVSWHIIADANKWINYGDKFNVDLWYELQILEWFKLHNNHSISKVNDAYEDMGRDDDWSVQLYGFNPIIHEYKWMDWDIWFLLKIAYDWQFIGSWINMESFEKYIFHIIKNKIPYEFKNKAKDVWITKKELFLRTERTEIACEKLAVTLHRE